MASNTEVFNVAPGNDVASVKAGVNGRILLLLLNYVFVNCKRRGSASRSNNFTYKYLTPSNTLTLWPLSADDDCLIHTFEAG